jgi:hypothetical protein
MNTNDIIQHHGVKGMKWGQRAARKISSGIGHLNNGWDRFMGGVDKLNKAYANTHRGMLDDYSNQRRYNNAEWKAVQRKTRKHAFSPLTKKTLQRQKEEYAKLKSYKDTMRDIDYRRRESSPNYREYVKKEHLAEYDKLKKITRRYRPQWGKGYDDWGKAYDRQVKLTKIGMDHHYAKAAKAYNDYINK